VQALRAAGLPVITWTIRNPAEQAEAMRYCDQVTFEGYRA
jgi:glycerophosphoryl diester phosphodiesterase